MSSAPKFHFIEANSSDIEVARKAEKILGKAKNKELEKLIQELIKHPHILEAFQAVFSEMAEKGNVAIASSERSLSSQEAADFLGFSRPFINKLLDTGIIPSYKAGAHRRIYFKDVLEYKIKRERTSRGLDELAEESEKLGLGWKSHS